ncbi:helix-turn-helix transcriptional regulator [Paenibacillus athensensis]|uniref:AraC family transcriptional regulator n=1 Tax=Paenibacillus athensensis TaxID=1967502 RepID=A0A4Y8PS05_9BACL|nr:AraC family transcriptional regulator [Paenibacillus athensensis]MCD1260476.1 helix-turn-helix transcriptional regulator [Paenibacillus athensensis]
MRTLQAAGTEPIKEEVVYQNPLLFLKIWEMNVAAPAAGLPEPWPWHYHEQVEFLALIEGELALQTKNDFSVLSAGDVRVLGSSQLHRTYKHHPGPLRYVVFQIDLAQHFDLSTMPYLHSFSELTRPLEQINYIFQENTAARSEGHALIMEIFNESQTRLPGYELAIGAAIKRLLLLLMRNDSRGLLESSGEESGLNRLRPALDYIDRQLGDKIAVEDVCKLLNLSYHYFIKYFKKVMGMSFVDYVNYKRIKKAERLLLTGDLSIIEVSYEVGIANMAQFYKLFKRHNQISPKEFKQRMRSETPAAAAQATARSRRGAAAADIW